MKLKLLITLPVLLLAGCLQKGPTRIAVSLADDLNNDHALPVQIAVFRARDVPPLLTPTAAKRWFADRGQALLDKEAGYLHRWEWVPGQQLMHGVPLETLRRPVYLIFAEYREDGCQAVVLRGSRSFRLDFEKRRFLVHSLDRRTAASFAPAVSGTTLADLKKAPETDPLPLTRSQTTKPLVISSQRSALQPL